jgi:GNAT superfamily N-acetyltransferase
MTAGGGGGPVRLSDLVDPAPALTALREIFFESSSRTVFSSEEDRQAFYRRWTSFYRERCPDDVWFWQDASGTFAGYLTGCRNSAEAQPLFAEVPGYAVFESCFAEFPAHFHVNCRADRRGHGLGARLVETFVEDCRRTGLTGLHLVTAPDARNIGFYQRLGFTIRLTRPFGTRSLLFMGRSLKAETRE